MRKLSDEKKEKVLENSEKMTYNGTNRFNPCSGLDKPEEAYSKRRGYVNSLIDENGNVIDSDYNFDEKDDDDYEF